METADPAIVAVRFATFGLAMLLFGASTFDLYGPRPEPNSRRQLLGATPAALLVLAAGGYSLLLAREADDASGWPPLDVVVEIYTATVFGWALAVTQISAATLALVSAVWPGRRRLRVALSAAALGALAFIGHTADSDGVMGDLRLALMIAHLLAVAAWLGALPRLASALRRGGDEPLALLRRFGVIGGLCVALIVATGLGSIAFMVAGAHGRLGGAYTQTLIVKLSSVLALLGVAAVNRFHLTPMFSHDPERARIALKRTIVLEQVLGLGALASVAVLGQLDPTM